MWNKIYPAVLAVAVVAMGFLSFYSHSWLGSIGNPNTTREFYEFYSGLFLVFLLFSSLILLSLANVLLWKTRHGWAMWTTFLFFCGVYHLPLFLARTIILRVQKSQRILAGRIFAKPVCRCDINCSCRRGHLF